MAVNIEEGQKCPECGQGELSFHIENCSCHISPPCSACTDAPLCCEKCGFEHREELYTPPASVKYETRNYKTSQELFDDLDDGVFGYVSYPYPGWGMQIRGKMPKNMTRSDVLSACGICTHGLPSFKHFGNGTFHFTYTYN